MKNNIKYEKFGIELNNENSGIQNGSIYTFSVSSVNASGESYVQLSTSVLPNEIKRLETVDNNRYNHLSYSNNIYISKTTYRRIN